MDEEFEFSIHEYTYIQSENKLKHVSHEADSKKSVKKMIRKSVKREPDYTKVILVLNGFENEEEAYVFENRRMLRVFSYDAFKAVEIIASLPFNVCSHNYLIEELTKNRYTTFLDEPDENPYPF